MKINIMFHESLTRCLIPINNLNTLRDGLNNYFFERGLDFPRELLENEIVWSIAEGRLGDEVSTHGDKSAIGKQAVSSIVTGYMSRYLTGMIAKELHDLPPVISFNSGPRSMPWQIMLLPDAFVSIHEMAFVDKRGYLTLVGHTAHMKEWTARQTEINFSEFVLPNAPMVVVSDCPAIPLTFDQSLTQDVVRDGCRMRELKPNRLWEYNNTLAEMFAPLPIE